MKGRASALDAHLHGSCLCRFCANSRGLQLAYGHLQLGSFLLQARQLGLLPLPLPPCVLAPLFQISQ